LLHPGEIKHCARQRTVICEFQFANGGRAALIGYEIEENEIEEKEIDPEKNDEKENDEKKIREKEIDRNRNEGVANHLGRGCGKFRWQVQGSVCFVGANE